MNQHLQWDYCIQLCHVLAALYTRVTKQNLKYSTPSGTKGRIQKHHLWNDGCSKSETSPQQANTAVWDHVHSKAKESENCASQSAPENSKASLCSALIFTWTNSSCFQDIFRKFSVQTENANSSYQLSCLQTINPARIESQIGDPAPCPDVEPQRCCFLLAVSTYCSSRHVCDLLFRAAQIKLTFVFKCSQTKL